jgi:hypothetical protein
MSRTFFHIHRSEQDKTRADNIMRILRLYKVNHGSHSLFEALAEIVEKEAAPKRPK